MTDPTNRGGYLSIFADRPITGADEDRLGFVAYADAFALLINDRATSTPLTVAVSGPWGSGKTSLARLLEERLSIETYWRLGWDAKPVGCWFNAWLHRDAPHLGAALAAAVARELAGRRPLVWRVISPLPAAMLLPDQRWWRNVWRAVVIGAAVLLTVVLAARLSSPGGKLAARLGDLRGDWTDLMAWWALAPLVIALLRSTFKVTDTLSRFIDEPRSAAAKGTLSEVREQLRRVISQVQGGSRRRRSRRVVVIVDDLERCPPEKALDVCEVAAHLLGHPDVITVLVADLDLIESAAAERYKPPGLGDDHHAQSVGEQYLHKLIQLRFNLPPLGEGAVMAAMDLGETPDPKGR